MAGGSDLHQCCICCLSSSSHLSKPALVPLLHFANLTYDFTKVQLFPGVFPATDMEARATGRYWADCKVLRVLGMSLHTDANWQACIMLEAALHLVHSNASTYTPHFRATIIELPSMQGMPAARAERILRDYCCTQLQYCFLLQLQRILPNQVLVTVLSIQQAGRRTYEQEPGPHAVKASLAATYRCPKQASWP